MRQKILRPDLIILFILSDMLSMTWKEEVINMTKCKHEYDEAEQRIEVVLWPDYAVTIFQIGLL